MIKSCKTSFKKNFNIMIIKIKNFDSTCIIRFWNVFEKFIRIRLW